MSATHTSLDLLAHFDGPATPAKAVRPPTRGVRWVLQWSAAFATLYVSIVLLAHFGYCLAWERALARAAQAAALEATLPRATRHSVEQTIARKLAGHVPHRLRFSLHHNGLPVRGPIRAAADDRLVVSLAASTHDMLPHWLRAACFWQTDSQIAVHAERQLPGRQLRAR